MVVKPGENPFFLSIITADGTHTDINLDASGWATTYADYLRVKSQWVLLHRDTDFPALAMVVEDGDQPYYTARHFGNSATAGEAIAYGIGKKCADGAMVRLWAFFPEGVLCSGDDVDIIGRQLLGVRQLLAQRGG
jgi:hypothetical protein